MSNRIPFSPDQSLVSDGSPNETIAWTSARSIMDYTNTANDSNNDSYVTADEENTRYLSVLETTNGMNLEDLNISLVNPKIDQSEQQFAIEETNQNVEHFEEATIDDSDSTNTVDVSGQQVVVFSLEGSDDLYGIQLVQDEQGNLQKYQFKLQTNEDGQLEAVADTIQLLPIDEEETEDTTGVVEDPVVDNIVQDPEEQDFVNEEEHIVTEQELEEIVHFKKASDDTNTQIENNSQLQFSVNISQEVEDNHFENNENITEFQGNTETEFEDNSDTEFEDNTLTQFEDGTEVQYETNNEEQHFEQNTETQFVIQGDTEEMNEDDNNASEGYLQLNEEELDENDYAEDIETKPGILNSYNIKEEIYNENSQEATIFEEDVTNDPLQSEEQLYEESEEEEQTVMSNHSMGEENVYQHLVSEESQQETEEIVEQNESDSQQYEEIYVEDIQPSLNDNLENIKITSYSNKKFIKYNLAEQTLKETGTVVEENIENDSDNDDYQIVEGLHITGDLEDAAAPQENILQETLEKPATDNSNILQSHLTTTLKDVRQKKDTNKIYYYVLTNPEKENVHSLSILNSALCKPLKNNPRSILKSSHVEVKPKKDQVLESENLARKLPRRKELLEERLFVNFINHTTIPHAPIRNERLPRKQKIKPVERQDEEIIVQEVVVSSNGFIETLEDGILKCKEPLRITECVTLTDSDDDYDLKHKKRKSKKKKEKTITISDSSDSDNSVIEIDTDKEDSNKSNPATPKRGRGRPKKSADVTKKFETITIRIETDENIMNASAFESSPLKRRRGRPPKHSRLQNEGEKSDLLEKKSKTEDEEVEPIKKEIKCPKCPKSFPSENSLKTHLQHHNLENSLRNAQLSVAVSQPLTEVTRSSAVLSRPSTAVSRPSTAVSRPSTSVSRPSTAVSRPSTAVPRPSTSTTLFKKPTFEYKHKCQTCNETFKNALLLNKHICSKKRPMCTVCKKTFMDQNSLNAHKRIHVKENLQRSTSFLKVSPKKSVIRKSVMPPAVNTFGPSTSRLSTLKTPKTLSYKCIECGKVCSSETLLNIHMKTHNKFTCNTCGTKFLSRILLDTHLRDKCVKIKSPMTRRLSYKIKKSYLQSPRRVSAKFNKKFPKPSPKITSRKSALVGPKTPKTSNQYNLQLPCELCSLKFSTYSEVFKHKVVVHGLNTPDKKSIIASASETKKKPLYKQMGTHGGILVNDAISKNLQLLKNHLGNQQNDTE